MSAVCVCVRGLGRSLTHNLGQTHAPARTFLTRTARTSRSTSPGLTRSFFGHWTLFVGRCRLSQRRSTPKHITHVTFKIRFEVKLKRQGTCNLSGILRFTRNKTFSKNYNPQCIHRFSNFIPNLYWCAKIYKMSKISKTVIITMSDTLVLF